MKQIEHARSGHGVMLSPSLAEWHIPIVNWFSETCFLIGIENGDADTPILSHHDDDEGYCFCEGKNLQDFLSKEVTRTLEHLAEQLSIPLRERADV